MTTAQQLAKSLREVNLGGNWTCVNLKDTLADVSWQQATTQVLSFNTIAKLVYHINYYIAPTMRALKGAPLDAHDKYSFDAPPVSSKDDWEQLLHKTSIEAETLAAFVEQLPDSKLWEFLGDEKYGTCYRNLQGIVEHTHYHLGQIVIIKKLLQEQSKNPEQH